MGGRYRLIEKIGSGGMSVVWRGQDSVLGRAVAIKVLTEGYASDAAFRDRMRREARAAARLSHPQVSMVYDLGEYGDAAPYMVMELIDGPSLADTLHTGPLPWRRAVTICAEVAAGLAAAHAAGLVHRDVKPGNVMLGSTGAKLVDFGISAEIGEGGDHAVLGTPAYVAPERLTGSPALPASDVYALGILLHKATTGRLPWDVDTKTQVLRAHLMRPPARLHASGLPDEVVDMCDRCLAKDPRHRPGARDVARVWSRAVGGPDGWTMLLPTFPGAGSRILAALRRRSHRVSLVAAGLTALGGIGVTAAFAAMPDPSRAGGLPKVQAAGTGATPSCAVTYQLQHDDGHAFTGDLTIRNTGTDAIPDPAVVFTLPGDQRLTGSSADWIQTGAAVRVEPGPLDPGAERVLPFRGTYTGTNAMPGGFAISDAACALTLVGVSGQPAAPPPAPPTTYPLPAGPGPQPEPSKGKKGKDEKSPARR